MTENSNDSSAQPATLLISWPEAHHPGDGTSLIEQSMEAGLDDGPLLVLPLDRGRGPKKPHFVPTIFPEVVHYLAHLSEYADDLGGERCLAIVQHGADRDVALAFLMHLQQLAAPGTDGIPKRRLDKRQIEPMDSHVIPAASPPRPVVQVKSFGYGLNEALAVYPSLKPFVCSGDEEAKW